MPNATQFECMLDAGLLVLFLAEAIIAKSQFNGIVGGWTGHMILTVAAVSLLAVRGVWLRRGRAFWLSPPHQVTTALSLAFAWAVLCCVTQPNAFASLAFLGVYAAHIYVCLYVSPNLAWPSIGRRSVFLYAAPLWAITGINMIAGTSASSEAVQGGRLAGLSDNATVSALLGAMAFLVTLWAFLEYDTRRKLSFAALLLTGAMLLQTRTRANICSCAIGSLAMLLYWARHYDVPQLKRTVALSMIGIVTIATFVLIAFPDLVMDTRAYLRASSREELFASRLVNWQNGLANAAANALLGQGPLAKFGNNSDPTVNDYEEARCYCNSWLAFAQAYGIPGTMLFALACLQMVRCTLRGTVAIPLLAIGILVSGIVSSVGHMWLVSFGQPSDRATWLILGLALATPGNARHFEHRNADA